MPTLMLEWWQLLLLLVAGLVAGILNTLAGGGSLLTLPLMLWIGMPATVANASNRISLIFQNISGSTNFHRSGHLDWPTALMLSACAVPSALVGAFFALDIDERWFRRILVLVLLVSIVVVARGRGQGGDRTKPVHRVRLCLGFVAVGFYAGFIQAGLGFALLALLHGLGQLDLVRANAVKVTIVLFCQLAALAIFALDGSVDWIAGLALAAGSASGAAIAVRMQVRKGSAWVRRIILVLLAIFSIVLLGQELERMGQLIRTLTLCAVLAGSATAASATSLDSLLSAHADSMGLSRQSIDPRCWHVVEELSGLGLTGTTETWAQAPASVRTRIVLGPLTMESWFDGQRGWISDRNGASREAEGRELEGMLVQALFGTGAWLLKKPPVPLAFAWDEAASTDSTLVIRCEPLLEKPLRIELDRRTLLPVRTMFETADGEQRQEFGSWDWFEGVRIATTARMELAGLLALDSRLQTVERLEPQPPSFFRPDGPADPMRAPDDIVFAAPVVEAPLVEDSLHLTVQGFLTDARGEEVPVVFLVDTGAGANFLDAGVASRLGLESQGEVPTLGVGGQAESSFVTVQSARIGDVRMLEQSWMASDFTTIRSWFTHPPSAVLGYDFLGRMVLEVDYVDRAVRFHDPATFVPPTEATALPLRMDANVPSIAVRIEGHDTWVHVDTGSNSGLDLAQPFVVAHGMLEDRETEIGGGLSGVGGSALSRRGTVASLGLGDIELTDVPTGFNATETGIFARDDVAGILGAEVLSHYHCWFDYPGRTLWLRPR